MTASNDRSMQRQALRAIVAGDIDRLNQLIADGLDILEVTEQEKWNFLHLALVSIVKSPAYEGVEKLLQLGVDVNAIDTYGNSPLHYAARLKNAPLVGLLLDWNAEVDPVNLDGVSPIREALRKPYDHETLKVLLEAGANIDKPNDKGSSVRGLAESTVDDPSILRLFQKD